MLRQAKVLAVGLALIGMLGGVAQAAPKLTVAVLYFDNNSGDAKLDVLQKGFADMLITDLSAVDGVTVVEREKLESLLGELKLQRSRYFDPRTAAKLGKGLGARYAVAGSIQAVKPRVRIDARLVDVATGRVVLATSVTGKGSEVFELEQKLVAALAAKISRTFHAGTSARKVNVGTLVDYSKAIDLADKGDLAAARKRINKVMRGAPLFTLARVRHGELVKRFEESQKRRKRDLSAGQRKVYRDAEAFLRSHKLSKLSKRQAEIYLTHRAHRGFYLGTALATHLQSKGGVTIVDPTDKKAMKLLDAYLDNLRKGIDEVALFHRRFARGKQIQGNWMFARADWQRVRQIGFDGIVQLVLDMGDAAWAEAMLTGKVMPGHVDRPTFFVAPMPVHLWPKRLAPTLRRLKLRKAALKPTMAQHYSKHNLGAIADAEAEYWIWRGDIAKAVTALQLRLDAFVTGHWAKRTEGRIHELLGLHGKKHHGLHARAQFTEGLKTCDAKLIDYHGRDVMKARVRIRGIRGLSDVVALVDQACRKRDPAVIMAAYRDAMYLSAYYKRCAPFEKWRRKVAAGLGDPNFGKRRGKAAGCNP